MHCNIVNVRAGITSEVLLFVTDIVLGGGNNAGILNSSDRLGNTNTAQDRIRTEAFVIVNKRHGTTGLYVLIFPIATSSWSSAERTNDWPEL